jgi:hypoxanthine phosphoribosyltransferase
MRISRNPGVVTFDQAAFDEACAELMRLVLHDGYPDALIGIRTGGLYVAESMARAAGNAVSVLSLTCRRNSTHYKSKMSGLKKLLTGLPRPLLDRMRLVEHALLTRRGPEKFQSEGYRFDPGELDLIDEWLSQSGPAPSLVIVDDAVDTGTTLSLVLDIVGRHAPPAATIRSAAITVTTPNPWALPRYTLYSQQLCRFPWSFDA